MTKRRISLFSIDIDSVDKVGAVDKIHGWLGENRRDCRYVVTPNVNHIVKLQNTPAFREAYGAASLVLADGNPIVMASQLLKSPLPEVVPGSDLVPALFDRVCANGNAAIKVFLLGAAPGVAERAASAIHERWASVIVTGTYSPPAGFEQDEDECAMIIARIAVSGADLLIIGLGAPKQELWIHKYARRIPVKAALCVGAAIDFLAGEKPRAPQWVREVKMEWFYRMATEPRRLGPRYLYDGLVFPGIFLAEVSKRAFQKTSA